jgi:hypothetical protein
LQNPLLQMIRALASTIKIHTKFLAPLPENCLIFENCFFLN